MSQTGDRHSAPPSSGLPDLHRRLAVVLADLTFPVQRWQLIAAAELYGTDIVTRAIIERSPEQRYQTLSEVVSVLGAVLDARPVAQLPSSPTSTGAPGPVPPRPVPPRPVPPRPVPPRGVAVPAGRHLDGRPAGSPRPAA